MMNNDPRLACIYHPIKVIFLDDNDAFLDALSLEFSTQINMLTTTDPDTVLNIINNYGKDITQSIFRLMNDVNVDTISNSVIDLELSKLLNLIYDKKRFDHVAILIIDYEMPNINGIEFCQKIKDRNILKIMLTAEADKDTAISAFNNGLIDRFILKTSENLFQEITNALHDLTQRYFKELSSKIINGHSNQINSLFCNMLYQQLFTKVISQSQAIEYYLVDKSGSFLFLDKDANPTWLIIRHVKELNEQLDLLKGYDLPEHLMNLVAQKEKILFLLSENEYKQPIDEWIKYLFDSKKLDENYYYSIIQDKLTDSIDWNKTDSYSNYLTGKNCMV